MNDLHEYCRRIREEAPPPPSAIQSAVDADLEAICLKCLAKQPEHRYRTAQAFADDLGRWQRGEPVEARRRSRLGRFWYWCRRKPKVAAMLIVLILSLASSTILAVGMWRIAQLGAREKALQIENLKAGWRASFRDAWANTNSVGVGIDAEKRLAFEGRSAPVEYPARLQLGLISARRKYEVDDITKKYFPLLSFLDQAAREEKILFNCFVHKHYQYTASALVASTGQQPFPDDKLDLAYASVEALLDAHRMNNQVFLLAKPVFDGGYAPGGAFIVPADSPITSPAGVKGHSLAFCNEVDFTFHTAAKAALLKLGLSAADFSSITNYGKDVEVLQNVRTHHVEVGVVALQAASNQLAQAATLGVAAPFKIIGRVDWPEHVWIISPDLRLRDPSQVATIKHALLNLQDPQILDKIHQHLIGFAPADIKDYLPYQQILDKAREFDALPTAAHSE